MIEEKEQEQAGVPSLIVKALAQSGRGLMVTDNEGTIIHANRRISEITGYNEDELVGANPRMLQSGLTPKETYLSLWNSISSGRPWRGKLQDRRKDRSLFWEDISIVPVEDNSGAITHFVSIVDEVLPLTPAVNGRTVVEREIIAAERLESLSTAAAGLAHDFNNLLTGILGNTYLLAKEIPMTSRTRSSVATIHALINRAAEINRCLALYSGCTVVRLQVASLRLVASEIFETFRMTRPSCSIDFQAHSECALGVVVDITLLREAVMEVLMNAWEATTGFASAVTLSVGQDTWELPKVGPEEMTYEFDMRRGSAAYIEVVDKGGGMDQGVLERAFDPFFSTKFVGRGLGLSSVLGVARCHHGAVTLCSVLGKGTTVRMYFPSGLVL